MEARHDLARSVLAEEKNRLLVAIDNAMPRLQAVIAVRLMRVKQVSA
jgi:hypothetical protein